MANSVTLNATQQQRNDTAENWEIKNPVLKAGEIGVETLGVNSKIKIGDGVTVWKLLPYSSSGTETISDYNLLTNKPLINHVTLVGDLELVDLGIQAIGDYTTVTELNTETTNRTDADNLLQNQIDLLKNLNEWIGSVPTCAIGQEQTVLTDFVVATTIPSRAPRKGDQVTILDRNEVWIYDSNGIWVIFSDGSIQDATTTTKGVVQIGGGINVSSGVISTSKSSIGLGNVDNTSDLNKPISKATQTALGTKVDKINGKGLSTNDYTNADKTKLTGIQNNAQVNTIEIIKQNNIDLPITNKTINIITSTKVSQLTNDSGYQTNTQVDTKIATAIDTVVPFFGARSTFPTTGLLSKIYIDTALWQVWVWNDTNNVYQLVGTNYNDITNINGGIA